MNSGWPVQMKKINFVGVLQMPGSLHRTYTFIVLRKDWRLLWEEWLIVKYLRRSWDSGLIKRLFSARPSNILNNEWKNAGINYIESLLRIEAFYFLPFILYYLLLLHLASQIKLQIAAWMLQLYWISSIILTVLYVTTWQLRVSTGVACNERLCWSKTYR